MLWWAGFWRIFRAAARAVAHGHRHRHHTITMASASEARNATIVTVAGISPATVPPLYACAALPSAAAQCLLFWTEDYAVGEIVGGLKSTTK